MKRQCNLIKLGSASFCVALLASTLASATLVDYVCAVGTRFMLCEEVEPCGGACHVLEFDEEVQMCMMSKGNVCGLWEPIPPTTAKLYTGYCMQVYSDCLCPTGGDYELVAVVEQCFIP
jgi:hypothetical protein